MNKSIFIEEKIQDYVKRNSLKLNEHQIKLAEYTEKLNTNMMGSVDVVQHFQIILKSINAKKCLEVGCFTGYTSMSMALVLPDDGQVVTCDITDKYVAKNIWEEAGVKHKIKLIIGNAVDTLSELINNKESFDFAFIDADKTNYSNYYEQCLKLIRKGGLIAIDNVLWSGSVLNPDSDPTTKTIHELNLAINNDPRVEISMLPIGDGVTFCYVK